MAIDRRRRAERNGCDAKHMGLLGMPAAKIAQLAKETAGARPDWMRNPKLLPTKPPPMPAAPPKRYTRSDDPGR